MSKRWTLDDIDWGAFDPDRVDPDLVPVIKTAALVEANSADYVHYLRNVFDGDDAFLAAADQWGEEEAQHGAALGRWAELVDPGFSFEAALDAFRRGYSLPLDAETSVRGSRAGELIARCVVESGTSSFYSAIRDATDEPVLTEIAKRIATDEFFHYQLFHKHFKRYRDQARLSRLAKLRIAVGRVQEAEDDELAYAYYAANVLPRDAHVAYDQGALAKDDWRRALGVYDRPHLENAARMILRAADMPPDGRLANWAVSGFWAYVKWRRDRLARSMAKAA